MPNFASKLSLAKPYSYCEFWQLKSENKVGRPSMQVCKYARICKYASMQVWTYMQVCKNVFFARIQVYKYAHICKYASMQVWEYASMQVYICLYKKVIIKRKKNKDDL